MCSSSSKERKPHMESKHAVNANGIKAKRKTRVC